MGAELEATHDTLRMTARARKGIVEEAIAIAATGVFMPTPVDISALVPIRDLRLTVVPSQPYVGVHGGPRFSGDDPMRLVEAAIDVKHPQLRELDPAVLCVELTGSDWGSHMWAIRTVFTSPPTVSQPTLPGLVGVLAYWQGRGSLRPYMSVWIANVGWTGPRPAIVEEVMGCLVGR